MHCMKKTFRTIGSAVIVTALILTATKINAQTVSVTQAVVTTTLVDVLAIAVTQPAIPLTFTTVDDYQQGKNIVIPAHVTVSSNRPYDLKVKALGDLVNSTPIVTSPDISIENLFVQVTGNTSGLSTNAAAKQKLIANTDVTLTNSSPAAMADAIQVTYSTDPGNRKFINTGVYTANLSYSVVAN